MNARLRFVAENTVKRQNEEKEKKENLIMAL